ncbi:serine/threonine-protein kinase [Micromonospora olivasterospora]|uniref:non-specific serine/threonine protein kinase n=1 Tax=Micromonospora olivasterospora TaxID=1880 RepID=A0A562I577_MICOL|nr:serine/threonine-protein kinase [Micromonospora olivasterospora]
MLTQGVLLGGRYLLTERVATGGMGAVWRCTDTLLDRVVAVKVLLPSLTADPEFTTRFHAEARMMAALRHPGIVAVHDFGQSTLDDGSQVSYLVMEYVDGEPLVTWMRRAGRLDPASTMSVVAQAAGALHVAHTAGIVHRDVKPGNLMVQRDGTVVLVDFGIARSRGAASITAAHTVLGTASYMSPEQATGQPVSAATDVYALGAVAYYCLAGRPPFDGTNPLQVAMRHAQDEPAPLPPGTPPPVVELIARAMAKRPADRYASAAELADAALEARDATMATFPVSARPPWAVPGPAPSAPSTPPGVPTPPPVVPTPPTGVPTPPPVGPARPMPPEAQVTPPTPAGPPPVPPAVPVPAPRPGGPAPYLPGVSSGPGPDGGLPATLETETAGSRRRRRLALAGVAAAVAAVLVAVVAATALWWAPGQAAQEPPAALDGGSAPAVAGPGDAGTIRSVRPAPTGVAASATPSGSARPGTTARPTRPADDAAAPSGAASASPRPGTTTTAPPKPNPYTAARVCGSGYAVIDSATLTGSDGVRRGRVFLLYKAATGENCVVTLKDTGVGVKSAVSAYLEVQGKARVTDGGSFAYYAGPVRAAAARACVRWGGSVGGAGYGSPYEHCG